jgi:hypothetical protein
MKSLEKKLLSSGILVVFIMSCSSDKAPLFWPQNGSRFQDVTWEIPVADSASVLIEKGGCWILPLPPDGVHTKIANVSHQKPTRKPYAKQLGRIDQEVVRGMGTAGREFYRFDKKGILLLGTEGSDSTSLLTIYNPPLILFPGNLASLDSAFLNESKPRIWNAIADTFKQDFTTRIRLSVKKRGKLMLDSSIVPAVLCKLSLSQDRTVGFGDKDLIVPDAVIMESNVLIAEGIGPVFEWGIRSREKSGSQFDKKAPMPPSPKRFERMELYIEATLHRVVH